MPLKEADATVYSARGFETWALGLLPFYSLVLRISVLCFRFMLVTSHFGLPSMREKVGYEYFNV